MNISVDERDGTIEVTPIWEPPRGSRPVRYDLTLGTLDVELTAAEARRLARTLLGCMTWKPFSSQARSEIEECLG